MQISWGFNPSNPLSSLKLLGSEITCAKQIFSALLYTRGIIGLIIRIDEIINHPQVMINLMIDGEKTFETSFQPSNPDEFTFELESPIKPKTKVEVIIEVQDGIIGFPTSSAGAGMGYHLSHGTFVPTTHLAIGIIHL